MLRRQINYLFFFSYFTSLALLLRLTGGEAWSSAYSTVFTLLAFGSYAGLYLFPAWLLTHFVRIISRNNVWASALTAILSSGLVQVCLYADSMIYTFFGFHINGFVLNLLLTPGGLASMGGDDKTVALFVSFVTALVIWQAALYWVSGKLTSKWLVIRKIGKGLVYLLIVAAISERILYGVASLRGDAHTLASADTLPFYTHTTFRKLGEKLGFKQQRELKVSLKDAGRLSYPLKPLEITPPEKPYNIIWFTSESLRADALSAERMPNTWNYAKKGIRFTDNISGGNGTRMGMFTLFSGLSGNYWFKFLDERKGAAVMDVLMQQNYQLGMFSSQGFSYPEFDQTIFSKVPHEVMSIDTEGAGWERDRRNMDRMLSFLEKRDQAKPFMLYMFFESPHARYYFPPEDAVNNPYLEEFNYATLTQESLKNNMPLIWNRYLNSVHHLDSVLAKMWDYLEKNNLRDNTIVIFTGDHGEEFMERGRWGHNSEFTNPQIKTPLVIWIPGQTPRVDNRLSSHMDVTATIMPLLGVKNPPSDYSLGFNLLEEPKREYAIVADWSRAGYVDNEFKATFPVSARAMFRKIYTDGDDMPLQDADEMLAKKQAKIVQTIQDMSRFNDKGK